MLWMTSINRHFFQSLFFENLWQLKKKNIFCTCCVHLGLVSFCNQLTYIYCFLINLLGPYNEVITCRLFASSNASAYYQPVPGGTDGIPERDQRPCDNGYKSVFTNSWLVLVCQRHRSWIKGLGKNPQRVHCLQCLLSGVIQP